MRDSALGDEGGVAGKTSGRGGDEHRYLLNVKKVPIKSSWAPEFSYVKTLHWSHLGVCGRTWALCSAWLARLETMGIFS